MFTNNSGHIQTNTRTGYQIKKLYVLSLYPYCYPKYLKTGSVWQIWKCFHGTTYHCQATDQMWNNSVLDNGRKGAMKTLTLVNLTYHKLTNYLQTGSRILKDSYVTTYHFHATDWKCNHSITKYLLSCSLRKTWIDIFDKVHLFLYLVDKLLD